MVSSPYEWTILEQNAKLYIIRRSIKHHITLLCFVFTDTSNAITGYLIAVVVLSVILFIVLVTITLHCLKRRCEGKHSNDPNSAYQDAVIAVRTDEYDEMQLKTQSETPEDATGQYYEIPSVHAIPKAEYINLGLE
jgi:hypothetical protein